MSRIVDIDTITRYWVPAEQERDEEDEPELIGPLEQDVDQGEEAMSEEEEEEEKKEEVEAEY